MKSLSKSETIKLFLDNCILIGTQDVIPFNTALEILGYNAMNYLIEQYSKGNYDYLNQYSIDNYSIKYVTESGFYAGVTYNNIVGNKTNKSKVIEYFNLKELKQVQR